MEFHQSLGCSGNDAGIDATSNELVEVPLCVLLILK